MFLYIYHVYLFSYFIKLLKKFSEFVFDIFISKGFMNSYELNFFISMKLKKIN